MARYVLYISFRNNESRLAVRGAHRDHLLALKEQGRLITAGPWGDDTGAMHVYEVADEDELRDILRVDPYTAADAYEIALLKEWKPIM